MIFRALILSQLFAERVRTFMTVLAVALGTALVLAIDLANATAVASFAQSVNVVANRVNVQVLGEAGGFDERIYPRLLEIPQIRDIRPIIEASITVDPDPRNPLSGDVLHVIGSDILRPLPDPKGTPVRVSGVAGSDSLIFDNGIILSERMAKRLHLKVGQRLSALSGDRELQFPIAGIIAAGTVGLDSSVAFTDIVTAQERFNRIGLLDRIDIQTAPEDQTAVMRQIKALLPRGVRVITPAVRTGEIERMLRSFTLNLQALAAIALLVGVFLVFNTVAISVVRRRSEIGVLRGLGASRGTIQKVFLAEGALFGVVGAIAGTGIGVVLAQSALEAVSKTVATLYVSTHADGIVYSVWPFVKAIVLGIASSLVAAYVPAREAAAVLPAASMRGVEAGPAGFMNTRTWLGAAALAILAALGFARLPAIDSIPVFGYMAGVCIIIAGAALSVLAVGGYSRWLRGVAPTSQVSLRLSATNMSRSQARVGTAVATLMTAIAMMISIAILVGSFRTTVVAWANESLRADLFVRPLGTVDASGRIGMDRAMIERMRHVPGIAAVDTIRVLTIPFRTRTTSVAATEAAALAARPRLRLLGNTDIAAIAKRLLTEPAILISEPFAVRYGVEPGEDLELPTPSGAKRVHIVGKYNDYSSDNGIILMDRHLFTQLFHDDGIDSLALYAAPGVDIAAFRNDAVRAAGKARVDVESTRELRGYVITVFDRTFAITYALYVIAIVIAALGIVTTLFALVLERRREIALLRYIGLSTGGVRRMIVFEAAGIGLLGGVAGILVGTALALDLIFVINRQSFGWLIELQIPWGFLVEALLAVIIASCLAGLIPAGIAARIRTAEALRND